MTQNLPDSRWSTRSPILLGALCVILLVGVTGAWSARVALAGAVVAQGRIEVGQNRQIVQHPEGGVVAEILAREGDQVEQGDLLIRLDAKVLEGELAAVEGKLLEILARRARLDAEEAEIDRLTFDPMLRESQNPIAAELMAGSERLFRAGRETAEREVEQLSKQRDQLADQIKGFQAQQTATATQLDLIEQELENQQSLFDQGLAQASKVLELQRQQAILLGKQGELASSVAQAEGKITEIGTQILRAESQRREDASSSLRDLGANQIELSEQRSSLLMRLDRLNIRAPVSGVIYGMQVFAPRSVIRAADPLLYLVPQDEFLKIVAQVAPINVDEVSAGQEVRLRMSAFDQRLTPELKGYVLQVSADTFQEEESDQSFYRADIEIAEGEMDNLPNGMALLPGMPVETFIQTGERTALEYLLRPAMNFFARAFRET